MTTATVATDTVTITTSRTITHLTTTTATTTTITDLALLSKPTPIPTSGPLSPHIKIIDTTITIIIDNTWHW